jgi:hypothetical protein
MTVAVAAVVPPRTVVAETVVAETVVAGTVAAETVVAGRVVAGRVVAGAVLAPRRLPCPAVGVVLTIKPNVTRAARPKTQPCGPPSLISMCRHSVP